MLERKRQHLLVNASVPFVSSETAWSQPEDDPDFVEMDVAVTDEERSDSEVEATADGAVWNDITHGDTSMHLVTGETELEVIYSDVASRTAINRERRSRFDAPSTT